MTEAALRLESPKMSNDIEILNWTLYDRTEIPGTNHPFDEPGRWLPGGQNWGAFQNPLGLGGHWRGFEETNLCMHGRLPMPQVFKLQRVFFAFDPDNDPNDNVKFRREVGWQFIIGEKVYATGPLSEFRTSIGLRHIVNEKGYPTGIVPADRRDYSDSKIVIDAGANFRLMFFLRSSIQLGGPFSFYSFLDGVLARPVC